MFVWGSVEIKQVRTAGSTTLPHGKFEARLVIITGSNPALKREAKVGMDQDNCLNFNLTKSSS